MARLSHPRCEQGMPKRPAISRVREYSIRPQQKVLLKRFKKIFFIPVRLLLNLLILLVYRDNSMPFKLCQE